jgi:hypothetical protein
LIKYAQDAELQNKKAIIYIFWFQNVSKVSMITVNTSFVVLIQYSDYHDFTGAPFLTTLTIQHAVFNDKCLSSRLDCPYNIQQSPETSEPKPTSLPPPKEDTGKSKGRLKVQMKRC